MLDFRGRPTHNPLKNHFLIWPLTSIMALSGGVNGRSTDAVQHPSEAQVRLQLADVQALRETGAQVREIRFSKDGKAILVLLDLPAGSKVYPELWLKDDGFNRYSGDYGDQPRKFIRLDFGKK